MSQQNISPLAMNIIVTVSEVLTQKQQEVRYDNIKFTQPGYQYVRNLATCIVTTDIDTYKTLTYEFEHMNGLHELCDRIHLGKSKPTTNI